MKKVMTMLAVAAVSISATADLTSFAYKGGQLTGVAAGTYTDGAVTMLTDLSAFVVGGQIDIADIGAAYSTTDIAVAPPFAGGTYSTLAVTEQPSSVIGETAYLVFDINGGGIQVGDFIGIGGGAVLVDLKPDANPAAPTQEINAGTFTSNIEVIPEPATIGLMGVAGLGLFLARRKARR